VINKLQVRLLVVCCRVSTWMGRHLWAGKPSRYVTAHLGQLSRVPACLAGVKAGMYSCVGWQVTLTV